MPARSPLMYPFSNRNRIRETPASSSGSDHPLPRVRVKKLYPRYNHVLYVEQLERYSSGGYHPIEIGDVLHHRFKIVDKLGYGGFSTVWLARDGLLQSYVAVKVNVSGRGRLIPHERRPPGHTEAATLRAIAASLINQQLDPSLLLGSKAVPKLLGEFKIHGPNGTHPCQVITPARQDLWIASLCNQSLFRIKVARVLAARLIGAVAFVHSRGYVHGDIYLRNVLSMFPSSIDKLSEAELREKYGYPEIHPIHRSDGHPLTAEVPDYAVVPMRLGIPAEEYTIEDADGLMLADFGEAFAPASERRTGKQCAHPLPKRAPEAYFEPDEPLSYPFDIWSLALAIWDIFAGVELFAQPGSPRDVIAQQIELFGLQSLPRQWRDKWERETLTPARNGFRLPRLPHSLWSLFSRASPSPFEAPFEEFVQKPRAQTEGAGVFCDDEKRAFLRMMEGMLKVKPEERWPIQGVLRCEWMVLWASSELSARSADGE